MNKRLIALLASFCAFPVAVWAAQDWPQWLGPDRSGHAATGLRLPDKLPSELKPLWRVRIGEGHASPVVARGKLVYTAAEGKTETVFVLDAGTGQEIWRRAYDEVFGDEFGAGPRSTPLVDEERVYVQSCRGAFECLDLRTGELIWKTNFEQFGVRFVGSRAGEGTASRRGNSGSGVIEGGRIILPIGAGDGKSLVCFDKRTGEVLWTAGSDEAAYSSLNVATLAGTRQVVAFTAEALMGVELASGAVLWRVPLRTAAKRHAATPLFVGDAVFVNSHTFGMIRTDIARLKNQWTAREGWVNRNLKINLATPVLVGSHLYSHGPSRNFVCIDSATGKVLWEQRGFGREHSAVLAADDRLLVLTDDGELLLLQADPNRFLELGRLQVCGRTWSSPAFANGKLFVRDSRELICLDLSGLPAGLD